MISTKQAIMIFLSVTGLTIAYYKYQKRNSNQKWTGEFEKEVYDMYYKKAANLTSSDKARAVYAECCVAKTKELFPSGVPRLKEKLPDTAFISIQKFGSECRIALERSVERWKPSVVESSLRDIAYRQYESKGLPKQFQREYIESAAKVLLLEFPYGLGDDADHETRMRAYEISDRHLIEMQKHNPDIKREVENTD